MAAVKHGHVAYGERSEEMKIFRQVAEICQQVPDRDLLGQVQQAITALRDIDS